MVAERVLFDRMSPNPPETIHQLRSSGTARSINFDYRGGRYYSTVMNNFYGDRCSDRKRLFVDAGCGNSPDAQIAIQYKHFQKAIKVDLWEPFHTNDFWRGKHGPGVKFIQGDICKLTDLIPAGTADFIGCNAVVDLMPLHDRLMFYEEAIEVLAVGGVLIVAYIPLAMGYRDWAHGRNEYEFLNPFGHKTLRCVTAQQNLLVIKKEPQ
jgi:SAM-dependent methyltransferase